MGVELSGGSQFTAVVVSRLNGGAPRRTNTYKTSVLHIIHLQIKFSQYPLRQRLVLPGIARYAAELQPIDAQKQRYLDNKHLKLHLGLSGT